MTDLPETAASPEGFTNLGLSRPIQESVSELGFVQPTPIQTAVIPLALEGHDVIGLAETGSGKTAAFCLPLGERLRHGRGIRGLILSPTREIALQTKEFLDVFGRSHDLETVLTIGGVKIGPQIDRLRKKPDIVVATPGRLLDHAQRRTVDLRGVRELVLDEADHMLDLGFLPQVAAILEMLPEDRRTMMFSATMPPAIERLAQRFMRTPRRVDLLPEGGTAEGIAHRLYLVAEEEKKKCLMALVHEEQGSILVFMRRRVDADWACRQLELEGHEVGRIHSDRSQRQRVDVLRKFRSGDLRILVATDVAARGIDIPRIEQIVNFDTPETVEDYIHRAGRTARAHRQGTVSTIGTWRDKVAVREIEAAIGEPIPRCSAAGVDPYVEKDTPKKRIRRRFL